MAWNKNFAQKKSFYKKAEKTQFNTKRGKLSPLMVEEDKQKAGIHELSYDFACRITRLYQYLTEDAEPMEQREQSLKLVCWLCRVVTEEDDSQYKEYVSSKQIYRSGTSVGANVRESKDAQSDVDFRSKI